MAIKMHFQTYAYTNPGGRKNNEDSYAYKDGIWVLADGLGGHDCGEIASAAAADYTVEQLEQLNNNISEENIIKVENETNQYILELQKKKPAYSAMRTTLVFAVTDGDMLSYANVGDSRFYFFRGNQIIAQSEDHSVSAAIAKMGEIRYDDIRFNEDRNRLLKVIGNDENLKIKSIPPQIKLQSGDAFLLCSDGFWEYVYEQEMIIDLSKSDTPDKWLSFMTKRLLLRTENKNNDNFTAVCVMIGA
ncbi:MAG: PP2C family protein-serine/threonine phosphatase [Eubacterium sp.]